MPVCACMHIHTLERTCTHARTRACTGAHVRTRMRGMLMVVWACCKRRIFPAANIKSHRVLALLRRTMPMAPGQVVSYQAHRLDTSPQHHPAPVPFIPHTHTHARPHTRKCTCANARGHEHTCIHVHTLGDERNEHAACSTESSDDPSDGAETVEHHPAAEEELNGYRS